MTNMFFDKSGVSYESVVEMPGKPSNIGEPNSTFLNYSHHKREMRRYFELNENKVH